MPQNPLKYAPHSEEQLAADIDFVKALPIVNTILQVVCETTGMRFAAIARVTSDRWIACSVRDNINFGIGPGDELKIETTICSEIRDSHTEVVIDNAKEHPEFCDHHTPKLYGFQSYISFPIIMQDGAFFGTLCAIDPAPAVLDNAKVRGMFRLFSELIAFHLEGLKLVEKSTQSLRQMNLELLDSREENRQYQYISNHNLQEPLRKMRMFSSMITKAAAEKDLEMVNELAEKIDTNARRFSNMIKELSEFSELAQYDQTFSLVDLNKVVEVVRLRLGQQNGTSHILVTNDELPSIPAIPRQMELLFYYLVRQNARVASFQEGHKILVTAVEFAADKSSNQLFEPRGEYIEIRIGDLEFVTDVSDRKVRFDLFSDDGHRGMEADNNDLAFCRKIVRQHGGTITATTATNGTSIFSIILPIASPQRKEISEMLHDRSSS